MDTRELKAADADRDNAVQRLRAALDEGRLTMDEYDTRVRQAYAARTYGDLDRLLADLPAEDVRPAGRARPVPRRAAPVPRMAGQPRHVIRRWLPWAWGVWSMATGVNVAIWAAVSLTESTPVHFWPVWAGLPSGAVLLGVTLAARREPRPS